MNDEGYMRSTLIHIHMRGHMGIWATEKVSCETFSQSDLLLVGTDYFNTKSLKYSPLATLPILGH